MRAFCFRDSLQGAQKDEHIAHLHARIEPAFLRKIADQVLSAITYRFPEYVNRSFIGYEDFHDHAQGSGFAGAIWPQQSEDGTLADTQAQLTDRTDRIVAFGYAVYTQRVHFHFLRSWS